MTATAEPSHAQEAPPETGSRRVPASKIAELTARVSTAGGER